MKIISIDGVIGRGENEISSTMIMEQLPMDGSPIHVKIHSEGGDVFEGFRIHDILASYPGEKKLTIESSAFSISSFIPMAFDDIEITPNGYMMLHPPRLSMEEARSSDLDQKSELLKNLESTMYASYAKRTGKPLEEIKSICERETFFNAEQCVAMGLANRITPTAVSGRVFAKTSYLPHGVITALFGAGSGGINQVEPKEIPMTTNAKVAATVKQIKAAFPKAKSEFVIRCMEKEMPLEEVASEYSEELQEENETLSAKVKAMEEELTALKANAMEQELAAQAKAQEDEMKAKAKSGAKPVAKGQSAASGVSARAKWNEGINNLISQGMTKPKASMQMYRDNPQLALQVDEEANV